jgi:hypothetical protein
MRPIGGFASCFLIIAASSCGTHNDASPTSAPDSSSPTVEAVSPSAICRALVQKGVAKDCSQPSSGTKVTSVSFRVVGVANYEGTISLCEVGFFKSFADDISKVAKDDYPNLEAQNPTNGLLILWKTSADFKDSETPEASAWSSCLEHANAASCAKKQPAYYEALRKLYTVATETIR